MAISRRMFLKNGAKTTAVVPLISSLVNLATQKVIASPSLTNKWPGRIVMNNNDNAGSLNQTLISAMMDDSIKLLTGGATVGEAWKAIFPSLFLSTKIAIKVTITSTGGGGVDSGSKQIVKGMTDGLQQMVVGGSNFPASNITIYEGNNNYLLADFGYNSTEFPGINFYHGGSSSDLMDGTHDHGDGAANNSPYNDALYNADYLMSVAHPSPYAYNVWAFSSVYKNHYGTYPPAYHGSSPTSDQYIRDIICTGPIYNKAVLWISNQLRQGYSPSPTILMSTDPVTEEFQAFKAMNIANSRPYGIADMPMYLRSAGGVDVAGISPTLNVGVIDESQMDIRKIVNAPVETQELLSSKGEERVLIYPNPANPTATIEYVVQGNGPGGEAKIGIYNSQGQRIREYLQPVTGTINRIVWDGRDAGGGLVSTGKYIVRVRVGAKELMNTVTLIK